jgi:para-aminobenzoate synthetase component 1
LLSDGGPQGRWSYIATDPDRSSVLAPTDTRDPFAVLRDLLGPRQERSAKPDEPPFAGGVIGLLAYEAAARVEAQDLPRADAWPDIALAHYPAVLAFDHERRRVVAAGCGVSEASAEQAVGRAASWLGADGPSQRTDRLADDLRPEPAERYEAAVAAVVRRIASGELFQANIGRTWRGNLVRGARPYDLLERLVGTSPAPFAAYMRLPGLALVSNSPERFVRVTGGGEPIVETRPIKGTRPRDPDPALDAALARELLASDKDRAENLMIVDLMRNDLSRVCKPGEVTTPELFRVETYANVHHLVSTVRGRLQPGRDAADVLAATFPPGSITGAPKPQAMRVISDYEGPRGPWCGALFWAGHDGALDSSVLIRSVAFNEEDGGGWRLEAKAGAGIVADSDPEAERLETEAKLAALRRALLGD